MLLLCGIACTAQRTTRRNLRPITAAVEDTTVAADSIIYPQTDVVTLSGYDKPLRSTSESLFATNHSDLIIKSVTILITYIDMSGRQLHSREVTIDTPIPPGETRQLQFRSWDRQKSFVYHRSQRPKRAAYSPYDIIATITSITVAPANL